MEKWIWNYGYGTRNYLEVSVQLHIPAALTPVKELPVLIG
jgi:hypothetical protein